MIADCACTDRKLLYAFGILVGGIVEVTMVFCMSFIPIMLHSILFGICNGKSSCVKNQLNAATKIIWNIKHTVPSKYNILA